MNALARRVSALERTTNAPSVFHIVHCRQPTPHADAVAAYCQETGRTIAPTDTVVFVRYVGTDDDVRAWDAVDAVDDGGTP